MRQVSFLNEEELQAYGNEELGLLLKTIIMDTKRIQKKGKKSRKKKSEAIVNTEAVKKKFKKLETKISKMSSRWGLTGTYHRNDYPNII